MYKIFLILLVSNSCSAQLVNSWPHSDFFDSTKKHIPTAWSTFIHDYHVKETKIPFFDNKASKMHFKQLVTYNFKQNVEFSELYIDSKLMLDSLSRNLVISKKGISVYGCLTIDERMQRTHLFVNWSYDQLTENAKKVLKHKQVFEINPFWENFFFFDKKVLKMYNHDCDMIIDASHFFKDSTVQARFKEWQDYLERKRNNPSEFWR